MLNRTTRGGPAVPRDETFPTVEQLITLFQRIERGQITRETLRLFLQQTADQREGGHPERDVRPAADAADHASGAIANYIREFSPAYREAAEPFAEHNRRVLERMRKRGRA